ncbi:MAG: thiamine phosphate synthase [Acidobacteriota bacterium]|nr:thiamine phosphate synthase [Acidobacteriota bacterium]
MPTVYPILDTASLDRIAFPWIEAAEAFLEGGAEILQFRHKAFWSREAVEAAGVIAGLCRAAGIPFVINDRADYATMLGAGLHVGQEDLTPGDARRVIGPDAMLGFSTHSPDQMRAAQAEPIDYVAFGPVFGTASKDRPDPVVGVAGLAEARKLTPRPLVAIGGIRLENAGLCFAAGADSVAVIGALLPAPCSRAGLRSRMEEWNRAAR